MASADTAQGDLIPLVCWAKYKSGVIIPWMHLKFTLQLILQTQTASQLTSLDCKLSRSKSFSLVFGHLFAPVPHECLLGCPTKKKTDSCHTLCHEFNTWLGAIHSICSLYPLPPPKKVSSSCEKHFSHLVRSPFPPSVPKQLSL